jgi:uncharacterized protein YndB with AHSA1/START domain
MKAMKSSPIKVDAAIKAPVDKVWNFWTDPKHIINWNNASDDWFTPKAELDLRPGGRFLERMEARDGSQGFDFSGEFKKVIPRKRIEYLMDDGRRVEISFESKGNETMVSESFDPEEVNAPELQRTGWQSILDNFKTYVEKSDKFERMHFEKMIKADSQKVFRIMFDKKTWSEWTSAFNPASHFTGNWEKGSRMLILGTDQDGSIGGMSSKIRENIPGRYMSIEYLGLVKNGKEVTDDSSAESWRGALENYTLTGKNGSTLLSIDCDVQKSYIQYFKSTWPKALDKLKEICERKI